MRSFSFKHFLIIGALVSLADSCFANTVLADGDYRPILPSPLCAQKITSVIQSGQMVGVVVEGIKFRGSCDFTMNLNCTGNVCSGPDGGGGTSILNVESATTYRFDYRYQGGNFTGSFVPAP